MPARLAIGWHSVAFLAEFLLLAALGWQGKRTQEALLQTNRSVSHSLEIITSVQAILSSLQDIETGSRGFILTGNTTYLEPTNAVSGSWKTTGATCSARSRVVTFPTGAGSRPSMRPSPIASK